MIFVFIINLQYFLNLLFFSDIFLFINFPSKFHRNLNFEMILKRYSWKIIWSKIILIQILKT